MIRLNNANIKNSDFDDINMADTRFHDCNLKRAEFNDVTLQDARFTDVSLKNVEVREADLTGMTINGVLVSELFEAYLSQQTGSDHDCKPA